MHTSTLSLRPYQDDAIEAVRNAFSRRISRVLLQMPTGGGKTMVFADIGVRAAFKGKRVLILVHRIELLEQAHRKLTDMGIEPAIVGRSLGWQDDSLAIAMIQTAVNLDLPKYHLVILDEAHHAVGATWDHVLSRFDRAYHLGVTATPKRLDGKGLDDHYDELIQSLSVADLTEQGYLARIDAYADLDAMVRGLRDLGPDPDFRVLSDIAGDHTRALIEAWQRRARGLPTIVFASGRRHGEFVRDAFLAQGVTAVFVDGTMAIAKRRAALADYAEGRAVVLVAVDLISEGFDVPETGCVVQARTTKSLTLHFQQIGRAMRPKADGSPMVLLDLAGNCAALGLPTDVIEWTLDGKAITKTDQHVDTENFAAADDAGIEAVAVASGNLIRIPTCLAECRTYREAKPFIREPADFLVVKERCRTRDGRPYKWAFVILACAETFYAKLPHHEALRAAADRLGVRRYLERAFAGGWAWTKPRSAASTSPMRKAG